MPTKTRKTSNSKKNNSKKNNSSKKSNNSGTSNSFKVQMAFCPYKPCRQIRKMVDGQVRTIKMKTGTRKQMVGKCDKCGNTIYAFIKN